MTNFPDWKKNLADLGITFTLDPDSNPEIVKEVTRNFTSKELTLSCMSKSIDFWHRLIHVNCGDSIPIEILAALTQQWKYQSEWNINTIFKYCESPIEQIFLNSINLQFIIQFIDVPVFTPPITYKDINELRKVYIKSVDICSRGDIYETIHNQRILYEKGVIDFSLFQEFENYLLENQSYADRYEKYHFTTQVSFTDLKIDEKSIRVDLLIWKPEDEKFKLVVECDGFQYHSNLKSYVNDRKRDRLLKSKGYDVFRFSGSEIKNEPFRASYELVEYLRTREIDRKMKK